VPADELVQEMMISCKEASAPRFPQGLDRRLGAMGLACACACSRHLRPLLFTYTMDFVLRESSVPSVLSAACRGSLVPGIPCLAGRASRQSSQTKRPGPRS